MTKRTPQREAAVLKAYASGKTLNDACRENGIGRTTFQEWRRADPDLNRRFVDAQRDYAEALIDRSMEIAANPTSAWAREHCGDGEPEGRDHIRHARLQIDTNLRVARILLGRHDAAQERRLREQHREEQAASLTARHLAARDRDRARHADAETRPASAADGDLPWNDLAAILEESSARAARGEDPYVPPPPDLCAAGGERQAWAA